MTKILFNPLILQIHPHYRPDIDGLRAIAVILVILFHAFPNAVPGGFVGVDIFFVISGYLISTILYSNLAANRFSILDFYSRRIRRIFPALSIVLAACLILGWFILLPDEYAQLGKHIAGGAGFIQNFLLWNESGYFDVNGDTKPLLHLWSLGVEEQFYIVWPFLLWIAYRLRMSLLWVTLIFLAGSFILNIIDVTSKTVMAFYSPQTRFWELLCGAILAKLALNTDGVGRYLNSQAESIFKNGLSLIGLILLIAGFTLINEDRNFPGWWALLPVGGSLILLLAGPHAWMNRLILSHPYLVAIGLISYPLYMLHWPALSFAVILLGNLTAWQIALILLGVFLGSAAFYRYVERPLRSGIHLKQKVIGLLLLVAILGTLGYIVYKQHGFSERVFPKRYANITEGLKWNFYSQAECERKYKNAPCLENGGEVRVLLLGDSHANHLYPGLTPHFQSGLLYLGTCAPLLNIGSDNTKNSIYKPCWSGSIAQYFDAIDHNPSIKTVALSAYWRLMLDGEFQNRREKKQWGSNILRSTLPAEQGLPADQLVFLGLSRTIERLQKSKKRIIFVQSSPEISEDFKEFCFARLDNIPSDQISCKITKEQANKLRASEDKLVSEIRESYPGVEIYDPMIDLCDEQDCYLIKNGKPLYRDHHHLSEYGSSTVGERLYKILKSDK